MVTFLLIAAGLFAVVIVAILFVFPPLLDKLQKKPRVPPKNLIAKLLGNPIAAILFGIAIPALLVMLYLTRPHDTTVAPVEPAPAAQAAAPAAKGEKMAPEHAQVVEDMAARLEQNPNDGDGWYMLAQSYAVMGRYADAVVAYEKALKLLPNNAQLLVDYADVMAVANDRSLRGKPMEMVNKALKIEPENVKGLALLGTAAFQAGEYPSAEKYWGKVLKLLPPESPLTQQIASGVAEAHAMANGKKTPSFGGPQEAPPQVQTDSPGLAGNTKISGVLTLSPALAGKAAPTDSVFLSAKELGVSQMPIAVIRVEVKDLPLKFTLDDSTAMMQGVTLAKYQEVMLQAKISKSGNTTTQPGDFIGEISPVKVGASGIQITINKISP